MFSVKSELFWSLNNFSLSPWIPFKLDSSHSHYVYIQPCENGQNLRGSKNPSFFHLKATHSLSILLWVHKQQHSWIRTKLGTKHPKCVFIHPCEYELILRPQKISPLLCTLLFSAKKCNFGVTYNYHECPWISTKLKPSHPHYES